MSEGGKRGLRLAVNSKVWNPTQSEWLKAGQCIQPEEKDRIAGFHFKRDAKSAMIGRLLLRHGVSLLTGAPVRALRFGRTEKGKPYLLSPVDKQTPRCDISFNISHQGDFVVLAAESGRTVGVDVMKVEWTRPTKIADFLLSLKRQLTTAEWAQVESRQKDMDQLAAFYRFWCLKESYVKALGVGIGFEVSRLDFSLLTPELNVGKVTKDTKLKVDCNAVTDWSFQESILSCPGQPHHVVAVAVRDDGQSKDECEMKSQSPEELFSELDAVTLLSKSEPLVGAVVDRAFWEDFSGRREEPGMR